MKRIMIAAVIGLCSTGTAFAESPIGEWAVQDGTAHIRIVPCGKSLWGVIAWTKGPPGKDENNPDPAKRERFGSAGRARVLTEFSPERSGRDLAAIYRALVRR